MFDAAEYLFPRKVNRCEQVVSGGRPSSTCLPSSMGNDYFSFCLLFVHLGAKNSHGTLISSYRLASHVEFCVVDVNDFFNCFSSC